jgi:pimeloyl-ACP methyl ester carboxylesterase
MKYKEYLLKSFDETLINVYSYGEGENVIVVSNGLGGNFKIFKDIIKDLPGYMFISWDYRGLYKSHLPKNKNDVTITHHINDLETILKKEKVKKAIFLGWSVGATINLQLYKKNPDLFKSLILLNPLNISILKDMISITRALNTLTAKFTFLKNLPVMYQNEINSLSDVISIDDYIYKLLIIFQRYHKIYSKFLKMSSKIPRVATYLKALKLVNSNMDDYFFEDIFREYAKLDMELYFEIVKDVLKYGEDDILPIIQVPTLLISSTRDIFVPINNIKKMKSLIPNTEYLEVFRGSHYALIEFPEMISLGIRKFLRNL